MTGTGQLLVLEVAAVVLGACLGYLAGRILRRRERQGRYVEGYEDGYSDAQEARDEWDRGHSALMTVRNDVAAPMWQYEADAPELRGHTVYAELLPEALADSVPLPPIEGGPQRDVPEPGQDLVSGDALDPPRPDLPAGLGHPSPYAGVLTPGQRRRDKHKQRGQYAPAQGWSAPDADMLRETWKPEGAHWLADWQIEWHDSVAAVDEEIAAWTERQRAWLAADRWDRGARRLGAVA